MNRIGHMRSLKSRPSPRLELYRLAARLWLLTFSRSTLCFVSLLPFSLPLIAIPYPAHNSIVEFVCSRTLLSALAYQL